MLEQILLIKQAASEGEQQIHNSHPRRDHKLEAKSFKDQLSDMWASWMIDRESYMRAALQLPYRRKLKKHLISAVFKKRPLLNPL